METGWNAKFNLKKVEKSVVCIALVVIIVDLLLVSLGEVAQAK